MNTALISGTAVAIALFAGIPAHAMGDIDDISGDLPPKPKVFVQADAVCDDEPGITYSISTHNAPANTSGLEMQWMDENGAVGQNIAQASTVPSGEGVFQVRALLHTTTTFYASDWQEVVVDCAIDFPLTGTPDFTG